MVTTDQVSSSLPKSVLSKCDGLIALWPGLLIATIVAIAARYLSEHYGGSVMLYALLIGMAFHFLHDNGRCKEGFTFAAKKVLRFGVALLGLRISFDQIMDLGLSTLALVVSAVLGSLLIGALLSKILKKDLSFGLLTGGAVGICGASAALALSSVMPSNDKNAQQLETDTLFTVIAVTTLSTIAMVVYPTIGGLLGLSDTEMGIMFGATIHDVAQVVGAGYAVSDSAGDTATIVKLMRVMMLLPVLAIVAIVMARHCQSDASETKANAPLPVFAFGFALCVLLNSFALVPEVVLVPLIDLSKWFLVIAISALGVMTNLKSLLSLGSRHIMVVVLETLILLGGVILAIKYLM